MKTIDKMYRKVEKNYPDIEKNTRKSTTTEDNREICKRS